jgi:translation initiation factor IF-3
MNIDQLNNIYLIYREKAACAVFFILFRRWRFISFTELRVNSQIRVPEVRVIDEAGNSLGVVTVNDAVRMAEERALDLVEISPAAKPPVCKLLNYGKYRYEQLKKDKESRKNQHVVVVKEVQIRPNIDKHDLGIKLNHALEFLEKGFKVKFVIRFRGREMEYKEQRGKEMLDQVFAHLANKGVMEGDPFREDKLIIFTMMPIKKIEKEK